MHSIICRKAILFTIVDNVPSDAVLHYIFDIRTTREDIVQSQCRSSFAQKVKLQFKRARRSINPED